MDAIAGAIKADPRHANRVVGTGRDDELVAELLRLGGFGKRCRIKRVVGVGDDDGDVQFANGAFLNFLRDAHGKMSDERTGGVAGFENVVRETHVKQRGFGGRLVQFDGGNINNGVGLDGAPID